MKNSSRLLIFLPFFLSFIGTTNSSGQTSWSSGTFEQKAFIENKGQFDSAIKPAVLFGASSGGVQLYFTATGLTYKHDELVAHSGEAIEEQRKLRESHSSKLSEEQREEIKREEEKMRKLVPHYLSIQWVGVSPDVKIISEDPLSFYYTYGGPWKDGSTTIKANAFRKIIYKDLYPNIDVEYIFPEGKPGIKYNVILHPGADPSVIKMKYEFAENISIDSTGNLVIQSSFGEFVDHAPQTFYSNDKRPITSSFGLNHNIVSFLFAPSSIFPAPSSITIDPWTTNPTFPTFNKAFDVNHDLNGNVYVYGSYNSQKLAKLNSAGVVQWIYSNTWFTMSDWYGDFAVDEFSGTSYLAEGIKNFGGSQIIKVNTLGVGVGVFAGSPNMTEMWRAAYNRCIGKIVIGGGGASVSYQGAVLDTNMTGLTPINFLSTTEIAHDMALLAIDNNSNFCYMADGKFVGNSFGNQVNKCPIPLLLPLAYSFPDGYLLGETGSVNYCAGPANGMNGMAVSPSYLYTYDSDLMKRWNKNTGALVSTTPVPGVPTIVIGNTIRVRWGGISVDECDNVYVGSINVIKEYNSSLVLTNTYTLADTVFDVKVGQNGKVYACGRGFVAEINGTPNNTTVTVNQTPASGCGQCDGTATVGSLSCSGNPAGFAYSWSTSAVQTTQTASGLCPGNYTVTLTTNCSTNFTGTVTVMGAAGTLSTAVTSTPSSCTGSTGSASASVLVGTTPYTYSWSPAGGTNATATGLAAGNYSVTISDAAGCSQVQAVTITAAGSFTVATSSTPASCSLSNGTATANITSGGTTPFTYTWSPSGGNNANASGLAAGNYTVQVIDAAGCVQSQSLTVTLAGTFTLATSSTPSNCTASNGSATANASGGTAPFSYSWNSGQSSQTASGLPSGNYSVTVTDGSGCTQTQTVSVTSNSTLSLSSSSTQAGCNANNGTATATASAGTAPYTYLWSSGQTTQVASALSSGSYSVMITDVNGCTAVSSTTVASTPGPVATASVTASIISTGSTTTLIGTGGGTYMWSPPMGLDCSTCANPVATPLQNTLYCVLVTDASGCFDSACVYVLVEFNCANAGEILLPNAFSPNEDGENDDYRIYYGDMSCIETFDIKIYNRWGEIAFQAADPAFSWDGQYKGRSENASVFAYYVEIILKNGEKIYKNGNISLIR